jgi:serine/threonine protein kinase
VADDARVPLAPGYILDGTYVIQRLLGKGGFALTYLAKDRSLDTLVAIKEFMPLDFSRRGFDNCVEPTTSGRLEYSELLARFKEEAQILVRMNHPSIVRVIRWIDANRSGYYVMEYLPGETLGAACKRLSRLPPVAVMLIVEKLLDGLYHIHNNNLLHRDLKPDNVILTRSNQPVHTSLPNVPHDILSEYGQPVLIDFGSARVFRGMEERTLTGFVARGFTPVEQVSADGPQDERTDIYSLAATAYTLLTGGKPDHSVNRKKDDQVRPLGLLLKDSAPAPFLAGLDSGLAVSIRNRPPDVTAWRRQLFPDAYGSERKPDIPTTPSTGQIEIASGGSGAARRMTSLILVLVALLLMVAAYFAVRQLGQDVSGSAKRDDGVEKSLAAGTYRAKAGTWQRVALADHGIGRRYMLSSDGPFRIKVGSTVYTVTDNRPLDTSDTPSAAIELKAIGHDRDVAIASLTR